MSKLMGWWLIAVQLGTPMVVAGALGAPWVVPVALTCAWVFASAVAILLVSQALERRRRAALLARLEAEEPALRAARAALGADLRRMGRELDEDERALAEMGFLTPGACVRQLADEEARILEAIRDNRLEDACQFVRESFEEQRERWIVATVGSDVDEPSDDELGAMF